MIFIVGPRLYGRMSDKRLPSPQSPAITGTHRVCKSLVTLVRRFTSDRVFQPGHVYNMHAAKTAGTDFQLRNRIKADFNLCN